MSTHNSGPPDSTSAESNALDLSLEDTLAQKMRGVPVKARLPAGGYNPYDATAPVKSKEPGPKPTDLRKLSEWIRLHRQVAEAKKRDSGS